VAEIDVHVDPVGGRQEGGSFVISAMADSHFFTMGSGVADGNATAAHHLTRRRDRRTVAGLAARHIVNNHD